MNLGLLNKSFREAAGVTILCGLGLMLFEAIISYIFWNYQKELTGEVLQIEFVRDMIQSLVGSKIGAEVGPEALVSLAWVHPLVLAILFTVVITLCTRVPAGEVDRGTIDVLFAWPVSRWTIYLSETIVWMTAGLFVIGLAVLGSIIGYAFVPEDARPELARRLIIAVNMFCLYLAIGGMAFLFSALSDRRGRAIGASVGVLITFLIWSLISQYWEPADRVSFLNILSYYKPLPILDSGAWPLHDIGVLLACGVPLWIAGGMRLARRDVCTV